MPINRRDFLSSSIVAGLVLSAPIIQAKKAKTYRLALIGSGWWGMNIARVALETGQCKMIALCDVDASHLNGAATEIEQLTGDKPKKYTDYRELLTQQKPDIVINATPDHWHALITIAAVKNGAHVYVEKPISHTLMEGRAMVNAAKDANRVVQVGTHRRVSPHNVSGMEFLKSGKAGKIGMVKSFIHYAGGAEEPQSNSEPPKGLDWDLWCGPAPKRPFNSKIHPRGFRQFLDYANGHLGDWGIHWLDQVLWWTEEKYPKTIYATGGRPIKGPVIYTDQAQTTDTPDHQVVTYEFESFTAVWEHRLFAGHTPEKGENVGCYFYGTKGTVHMGWRQGWTFYPAGKGQQIIHQDPQLNMPDYQNIRELWVDLMNAIETGSRPACDIEIGYLSTNMSLLGMLSYKLGQSIRWDGEREVVLNNPQANQMLRRPYRDPWVYPEV